MIVPTYLGRNTIARCLNSIAVGDLDPADYEVLIIRNGPEDGTSAMLARVEQDHPKLQLRILGSEVTNAGAARNVGIDAARGRYLTFVDDDDAVSPSYLSGMLQQTAANRIVVAGRADYDDAGRRQSPGPYQRLIDRSAGGGRVGLAEALPALNFTAAKLVDQALVGEIRFDEDLASGEDVVFWMAVVAQADVDPELQVVADPQQCRYDRLLRPGTVSRQMVGEDFQVWQRMATIDRIAPLFEATSGDVLALGRQCLSTRVLPVARWARTHPGDRDRIRQAALDLQHPMFPWATLNAGLAEHLLIAPTAPPSSGADSVALVARAHELGVICDVLCAPQEPSTGDDAALLGDFGQFQGRLMETAWPRATELEDVLEQALHTAIRLAASTSLIPPGRASTSLGPSTAHALGWALSKQTDGRWTADLRASPLAGSPMAASPSPSAPLQAGRLPWTRRLQIARLVRRWRVANQPQESFGAWLALAQADEVILNAEQVAEATWVLPTAKAMGRSHRLRVVGAGG